MIFGAVDFTVGAMAFAAAGFVPPLAPFLITVGLAEFAAGQYHAVTGAIELGEGLGGPVRCKWEGVLEPPAYGIWP
jgi:hypothetical protein